MVDKREKGREDLRKLGNLGEMGRAEEDEKKGANLCIYVSVCVCVCVCVFPWALFSYSSNCMASQTPEMKQALAHWQLKNETSAAGL